MKFHHHGDCDASLPTLPVRSGREDYMLLISYDALSAVEFNCYFRLAIQLRIEIPEQSKGVDESSGLSHA
jgi:hypothetical protein